MYDDNNNDGCGCLGALAVALAAGFFLTYWSVILAVVVVLVVIAAAVFIHYYNKPVDLRNCGPDKEDAEPAESKEETEAEE